jgi:hypothetical protein
MDECKTKKCKQKLKIGWSFCPTCGRDNRPKSYRPAIIGCKHVLPNKGAFCVLCGEHHTEISSTRNRLRSGAALITTGIGLLAFAFYVRETAFSGNGLGFSWINSWFDDSVILPGNILVRGSDVPSCLSVYAISSVAIGGVLTGADRVQRLVVRRNAVARKPKLKDKPLVPQRRREILPDQFITVVAEVDLSSGQKVESFEVYPSHPVIEKQVIPAMVWPIEEIPQEAYGQPVRDHTTVETYAPTTPVAPVSADETEYVKSVAFR